MELYGERGYEQTTVAEIAARAGLTERTFFRHYADKREVLFSGTEVLRELLVGTVVDAPPGRTPLECVTAAITAAAEMFQPNRAHAVRRQAIIDAHVALQERELIKLATLSAEMAAALRARGVSEPEASLAAEAGTAAFRVSFERWVGDGGTDLPALVDESVRVLGSLAD